MKKRKLTLEDLAPYLPYGLKVWNVVSNNKLLVTLQDELSDDRIDIEAVLYISYANKPILRPLSDISDGLFKSFEFCHEDDLFICIKNGDVPYKKMVELFKYHFDLFGLIDAGLAIDINTI